MELGEYGEIRQNSLDELVSRMVPKGGQQLGAKRIVKK
jgi:hypothetical protein